MPNCLRIAVLVCDTPIQPVLDQYGDYYDIFQGLLKQGLNDLELPDEIDVQFSGYHVVNNPQFPNLRDYEALIMTGSSEFPCKQYSSAPADRATRTRCLG
jgi:GMP synthase (glutamine-hydrolysing)